MKKLLFGAIYSLAIISLIVACKEEEPPPPHPIVGKWDLDAALLKNLPVGYQNYQDIILTAEDLIGDGDAATTERFVYEFKNDNTYKQTLFLVGPNDVTTGIWSIEETQLALTPDEGTFDSEFEILGEIEETEMTLSTPEKFNLFIDDFTNHFDTLTSYTFEGPDEDNNGVSDRWEALQDEYMAEVDLTLWYIFER